MWEEREKFMEVVEHFLESENQPGVVTFYLVSPNRRCIFMTCL